MTSEKYLRDKTVADNLMKAVELINKNGWVQGSLVGLNGSMCIRGAIAMAISGNALDWNNHPEDEAVAKFLGLEPIPQYNAANAIAVWNNRPGRTQEEVIAALDGAAKQQLAEA